MQPLPQTVAISLLTGWRADYDLSVEASGNTWHAASPVTDQG